MADFIERLIPTGVTGSPNLPAARTTMYTVPASTKVIIRHMGFVNTTAADITVQLWLHGYQYEMGLVVPARDSRALDVASWVLAAGELIEAQASAVGINMICHGVREA